MLERMPVTNMPLLTITEGRTMVSPVMAAAILNATAYEGQRRLQQPQVDKYAMMIVEDRGEFLRDQGISFGRLKGKLYLLNGQHRLNALIRSGRSVSFDFTIYDCLTEEDLARHYARFDCEHLSRSLKDVVANDVLIERGFTPSYLARVCEAVTYIEIRFKNIGARKLPAAARIKERRLESARPWEKQALLYRQFSKGLPAMKAGAFYAAAPLAVALVTLKHEPDMAGAFWSRAIRDDGLRSGDPAKALIDVFARKRVPAWTRYERGHLAAIAWNAVFEERDLHIVRLPKTGEMYIAGTPY